MIYSEYRVTPFTRYVQRAAGPPFGHGPHTQGASGMMGPRASCSHIRWEHLALTFVGGERRPHWLCPGAATQAQLSSPFSPLPAGSRWRPRLPATGRR